MHSSENSEQERLPKRFPVGSTYVIEGRGGEEGHLRVFSRYLVLPGGRRINLSGDFGGAGTADSRRRTRSRAESPVKGREKQRSVGGKKFLTEAGTTRQRRG
jgi:hypothetical protein